MNIVKQKPIKFKLANTKDKLSAMGGISLVADYIIENFIKELKNGFGMNQMPCGQTYANAVFFRIGVLAYNIFIGLRNIIYPHNPFKQTIETMRFKIINVAGKIVNHARQFILKIYGGIELLQKFIDIRNKIYDFKEQFA